MEVKCLKFSIKVSIHIYHTFKTMEYAYNPRAQEHALQSKLQASSHAAAKTGFKYKTTKPHQPTKQTNKTQKTPLAATHTVQDMAKAS